MNTRLQALHDAGVSIWLDDLSRHRITSGNLAHLIDECSVTGVTTNPTIFAAAFHDMSVYGDELTRLKKAGADVATVIRSLMADDVRAACDIFAPIHKATDGDDGRVSIEVDPTLADDTAATITQARLLREVVDRPNVLIKIPATKAGLPAIRAAIGAGISVNVTLIFSVERYREVMTAYVAGLGDALDAGLDLSSIHSVASIFVSRVDTEVDKRLEQIGTKDALALRGQAAVANARLGFDAFLKVVHAEPFQALAAHGARVQRPLWASTGTKNPAYSDTRYVDSLIVDPCVNTMPEATLLAVADHGDIRTDTVTCAIGSAAQTWAALRGVGIDESDVMATLERQGVDSFIASWNTLVQAVTTALAQA